MSCQTLALPVDPVMDRTWTDQAIQYSRIYLTFPLSIVSVEHFVRWVKLSVLAESASLIRFLSNEQQWVTDLQRWNQEMLNW